MKTHIALAFAGAALISLPVLAQTTNVPSARGTPAQTSNPSASQTQLKPGEWQATKIVGLDVYNAHNDKIGDIKQLIIDKEGTVRSVLVAAGGFLGMDEHDVAIPFKDLRWSDRAVSATNTSGSPNPPTAANDEAHRGYPDHAILDMSKDQLKRLPDVRY